MAGSGIDRRQVVTGVLAAAAGWLAAPARPLALGVAAPEKAYGAFFMGQGGYFFSWGIPYLAAQARALWLETDIYGYSDLTPAWKKIAQKKRDGYKIALIGYSLGNTTITYLQRHFEVDLLLAISESSLGRNHPIKKENTRRSVLWYGPDFLSNAGLNDGFDEIKYINNLHLWMDVDPRVVKGVIGELKGLMEAEKIQEAGAIARTTAAEPIKVAQVDAITAPASPYPRNAFAGPLVPSRTLTRDITCTECWGLAQSLAGPPPLEAWVP